jgi:hypothetical protein
MRGETVQLLLQREGDRNPFYDGAHGGAAARVAISSVDLRARGPSFLAQARSAKTHQNSGSGCASRCRRQFVHRG